MPDDDKCDIKFKDTGNKRVVTISGPHYDIGGYRNDIDTFETYHSIKLLKKIQKVIGNRYFKTEIDRELNPRSVQQPLEASITPIMSLKKKVVLDFGSGGGSSAIGLGKLGAGIIHGVDVTSDIVEMASLRIKECGLDKQISFHYLKDTTKLPFESELFDIIVCNAVFEHIHPKKRPEHLHELWRILKPKGYIFILGSPNRLWPYDAHTTHLILIPYLPLRVARWYAILFSRRVSSKDSIDELIARGIRGVTYFEIRKGLPGCVYVPNDDVNRYFKASEIRKSNIKSNVKPMLKKGYKLIEKTICRSGNIPVAAFLPYLSLCFQKT